MTLLGDRIRRVVNRMLIPGQLLKRAAKGNLNLLETAKSSQNESANPPANDSSDSEIVLANECKLAANAKTIALLILGAATQKFADRLAEQQEILMGAADIIMDAYQMESAIQRARKAAEKGNADLQTEMARVFCADAIYRVETRAKITFAAMSAEDELQTNFAALKRLTKNDAPVNTVAARRQIADGLIQANRYVF